MSTLMELQRQFQNFLLNGQPGVDELVIPTALVPVEIRLGIYRDAYKLRLIECLSSNFPGLYIYLGTMEFEKLCSAYIEKYPSTYRSIRWYGSDLAHFIKNYYTNNKPYLLEFIEFEWRMTLAFDAADVEVVQIEAMPAVPAELWAGMQFILHPSVQRLNFCWNVIPLWQALMNDLELPVLSINSGATPWIMWRSPEYLLQFYSLSEEEAWALDGLIQGLSFGELCEGLCQWVTTEEVGMRAASYLKGWIQNGMVSQLMIFA